MRDAVYGAVRSPVFGAVYRAVTVQSQLQRTLQQTACMGLSTHPDLCSIVISTMQVSVQSVHTLAYAALLYL